MKIEIIVGTTLGSAEYVADDLQEILKDEHQVQIHLEAKLNEISQQGLWLICTSTHGAGDIPDNLQGLFDELSSYDGDPKQLKAAVIGIGSSSYDTFCGAAKQWISKLAELQIELVEDPLFIDVDEGILPEEKAVEWLESWKNKLSPVDI